MEVNLKSGSDFFVAGETFKAPLSREIQKEYNNLIRQAAGLSTEQRTRKEISGTGGLVSPADLIAYQIGWGKLVIGWYEAGIKGIMPDMPGDGFNTWNYTGLALHFYEKYQFHSQDEQYQEFFSIVQRLIRIVEAEHGIGNLEKPGVWEWCRLKSGKYWPLSKWIRVNTVSPYKKAAGMIKKTRGFK